MHLFIKLQCIFMTPAAMRIFAVVYRPEMKQLLHSGTTLIIDRYAFSGVAYTAAKEVCFNFK